MWGQCCRWEEIGKKSHLPIEGLREYLTKGGEAMSSVIAETRLWARGEWREKKVLEPKVAK
jgi:hypothetical protein